MDEMIRRTRETYNRLAEHYVTTTRVFNETIMHPRIVALAERFGDPLKGKIVLDLGCGAGALMRRVEALGAEEVHGVDISAKLLAIARSEGTLNVRESSMHNLPFLDGTFNVVLSNFAVHYLDCEGQAQMFREVRRVLRPEGLFVYSTAHPIFLRFSFRTDEHLRGHPVADSYFSTQEECSWPCRGESISMIRRDWPDIANAVIESGLTLLRLVDADVPENLEDAARASGSPEVADHIRSFARNPFGMFVVARK